MRAELQTAYALGEQLFTLAQQAQEPVMLVTAWYALGRTLFFLGTVASAHTHLAQGIALYDSQQHRASAFLYADDAGVVCHIFAARALWFLGYPDQGLVRLHEAVTLAQQSAHPFSLCLAWHSVALCHQYRREVRATQERAEAIINLATEQELPWLKGQGSMLRGWVLTHQGLGEEGIEHMHQGLTAFRATGAELAQPYFLALLAEAHRSTGDLSSGLDVLNEALTLVDTTGERWYESEIYRLKGELLLQQFSDDQAEAETCFHHALEIARTQQAKSFELRAATSLARLWQQQGKRQEAYDLLAPIYGWFTEGFDTMDLQEVKALLEALA
jgi:predicted ATPase